MLWKVGKEHMDNRYSSNDTNYRCLVTFIIQMKYDNN